MTEKKQYNPTEGDLVCLLDENWGYCGFGTVIEVIENSRMCHVYWHDIRRSFYEYVDDLSLYDDADLEKCREFMGNRRRVLDFYDL